MKIGKMKISLIIFTLNEIEGMRIIMPKIKKEWYDELVIIDGGSTDGTIEYARDHGYSIFVQRARGLGVAFVEAMERSSGDVVIIFSPDGNSIPEKIPELVAKIEEGNDIVIASRYLRGARSYDDDLITAFGNRMFTGMINLMFGTRLTDCLVMYRAFKRNIVDDLKVNTRTVAWGTQLLTRAIKQGLRIAEIPVDEPVRIGGVRKMQPLRNGLYELAMVTKEYLIRRY